MTGGRCCVQIDDLRNEVVGVNKKVPILGGELRDYINFDNAASTPTFRCVWDKLYQFMEWYSNVHRGTGFKSQLATWAFDQTRQKILQFVGANPESHVVIFGKNSSEMINRLANRLQHQPERKVVLTTLMEHHSNDLPWRKNWQTVHVMVDQTGAIDEEDLMAKLKKYNQQVRLLAISGASNVTGIVTPMHRYAQLAHSVGAEILVDAAQLVPHRAVRMADANGEDIDYLVFSAHKVYAPFGIGVLVGRKDNFSCGDPDHVGGGSIEIVTLDEIAWTKPPEKDEVGTPNIPGAIALGIVLNLLTRLGMDKIAQHEKNLTRQALIGLHQIPGVEIFGPTSADELENRLGVITFNLADLPHNKLAAILSWEVAIGVRNGCFCAHPYVTHLLAISPERIKQVVAQIKQNDRSATPGAVRISFGCYNTSEEVDYFLSVLNRIARREIYGEYQLDGCSGQYRPKNWDIDFNNYFAC